MSEIRLFHLIPWLLEALNPLSIKGSYMKNIARIPALIILSCAMIFGCGKSEPPKKAPDEVKLQLKWTHQAQFAGFYMANEKGYYAKELSLIHI